MNAIHFPDPPHRCYLCNHNIEQDKFVLEVPTILGQWDGSQQECLYLFHFCSKVCCSQFNDDEKKI